MKMLKKILDMLASAYDKPEGMTDEEYAIASTMFMRF